MEGLSASKKLRAKQTKIKPTIIPLKEISNFTQLRLSMKRKNFYLRTLNSISELQLINILRINNLIL